MIQMFALNFRLKFHKKGTCKLYEKKHFLRLSLIANLCHSQRAVPSEQMFSSSKLLVT